MQINTKQFKQIIKNIDSPIYLVGHKNPDYDSICSCFSLARMLEKTGKTCYILLEEKDQQLEGLDLDSRLFVNNITTEDFCLITLDMNENYMLGNFEKYYSLAKTTINIDHHQGNKTEANFVISEPDKSSTSEIVYNIISSFGAIYFDQEIAKCLYTGIMTDTNGFSRRLSNQTLSIAQKLINLGVDYEQIIRETHKRTFYEMNALSTLIPQIQFNNSFHYVIIDKSLAEFSQLTHNQITKFIGEELRKLEGIDIMLVLIQDADKVTCKTISNISQNAHNIAEIFGGGGHLGEAGFTTTLSIEEILDKTRMYLNN